MFLKGKNLTHWMLLLLIAVTALAQLPRFEDKGSEQTFRAMVRAQTQIRIDRANEMYGQYYTSGHNKFSVYTSEELHAYFLGGQLSEQGSIMRQFVASPQPKEKNIKNSTLGKNKKIKGVDLNLMPQAYLNNILPNNGVFSIDYRQASNLLVTPVKDQGACGSCWSFAGIAELETYFMKTHNIMLDLSEQQMIDCVTAVVPSTKGCSGGQIDAIPFYAVQYPVATEKYYPYTSGTTSTEGTCSQTKISAGGTYKINYYTYISGCVQLANTLLVSRPVAICGVIPDEWFAYTGGVLTNCTGTNPGGHCLLAAGVQSDGTQNVLSNFWILKNSWGVTWGENGYIRLYRDPKDVKEGLCSFCGGVMSW